MFRGLVLVLVIITGIALVRCSSSLFLFLVDWSLFVVRCSLFNFVVLVIVVRIVRFTVRGLCSRSLVVVRALVRVLWSCYWLLCLALDLVMCVVVKVIVLMIVITLVLCYCYSR